MLIESRQEIKTRILRVLSRVWGHQGAEAAEVFDPVVQLLINAVSGELERISGEAYTSHLRLADRLSELLVPGVAVSAFPAHAIMLATPSIDSERVQPQDQFFYQITEDNPYSNIQKTEELYFSPTDYFQIHKTEIKYIAAKNQLIEVSNKRYKEVVIESKNRLSNAQMWIGLSTDGLPNVVENLRFFFELEDKENQDFFNFYLKQSEWFIKNTPIEIKQGYDSLICGEKIDIGKIRSGEYSDLIKQLEEVNSYYKDNFITLSQFEHLKSEQYIPTEIKTVFGENIDKAETLLWINIQFYETIPDNMLNQLSVYANAFPVVNRKLHELTSRMEYMLNIIPLKDENYFWNLEDVVDADGNSFRIKDISEQKKLAKRTALLRREGVGRLDQRSAITQVQNLLNAIKDERASFARIDSNGLSQNLKDLTSALNRISEMVENVTDVEDTAFLMIKNEEDDNFEHNIFIKFWTTAGTKANDIAAGTQILSRKGVDLLGKQGFFVTATIGGKDKANREEMLSKMRKNWLTRDRIVTNQDIINTCYDHFGSRIANVIIKKGIGTDTDKKYGLNRTLDIFISPNDKTHTPTNEWDYLQTSFYELLKNNSSNAFKYRIFKV